MNTPKHIINKIFFEVNTPDTKTAYYLKDNLDVFLKQSILPTIRTYFDSISGAEDQIIRMDKVEVNIDSHHVQDQMQLQLDIVKALQKQLISKEEGNIKKEKHTVFSITNKEQSNIDTFFYFLKTGQHPWWNFKTNIFKEEFINTLISDKNFTTKLKTTVQNKTYRQRLVYQFSDALLSKIVRRIDASSSSLESNREVTKLIKKHFSENTLRNQYWEMIIRYVMNENITSLKNELRGLLLNIKRKELAKNSKKIKIKDQFLIRELKKTNNQVEIEEIELKMIKEEVLQMLQSSNNIEISIKDIAKKVAITTKQPIDTITLRDLIEIILKQKNKIHTADFKKVTKEIVSITAALTSEYLDFSEINEIKTLTRELEPEQQDEKEIDTTAYSGEIYINNAGLVLLHPYIKMFFKTINMIDNKGTIKLSEKEKAVHLLHYLATKEENPPESSLIFEKFLCGFPIEKPIKRTVMLSRNLKNEAEELLDSILKNWGALKNTSSDGLREGFIKRDGKLILNDPSKYRIIVERKTQDILLEQLPWNLTMIKLPWIDRLIFVEW